MLRFIQFGDLHVCEGDGWQSLDTFRQLVASLNHGFADRIHFAVLPGDNANHSRPEEFMRIADIASGLTVPLYVIPGDHDFESGHLDDYFGILAPGILPRVETVGNARVILLDIVSAGSGGPDFRLGQRQTAWLRRTLNAEPETPAIVFMHAFPGDLREGSDEIAALLAEAGVAYVGTGHTHYNDLLNDGHVIYGATRSTGEIEEGGPGFTVSALDGDVVSWRFKELDGSLPFVLITSPSDLRLVTDGQSRTHVPEDFIEVHADVFGTGPDVSVLAILDGVRETPMLTNADGGWRALFDNVADGLHTVTVRATTGDGLSDSDLIDVLVRNRRERPKRGAATALGRDIHSVRQWTRHGIPGGRLGPNANGRKW